MGVYDVTARRSIETGAGGFLPMGSATVGLGADLHGLARCANSAGGPGYRVDL